MPTTEKRREYLRVWVMDNGWRELDNGPFPITVEQLERARNLFAAELAAAKAFCGARHAPQTATRAILKTVAPELSGFDILMLGFAVTNSKVKHRVDVTPATPTSPASRRPRWRPRAAGRAAVSPGLSPPG